jgi:hypothetical protein
MVLPPVCRPSTQSRRSVTTVVKPPEISSRDAASSPGSGAASHHSVAGPAVVLAASCSSAASDAARSSASGPVAASTNGWRRQIGADGGQLLRPTQTLGLTPPWTVSRADFDVAAHRLDIHIGFAAGGRFACPGCGAPGCPVHDTQRMIWRHLNFFQHQAYFSTRVPRIRCERSGGRTSPIEDINSLMQATKAKARGYRSSRNLKAIIYLVAEKLDLRLPV